MPTKNFLTVENYLMEKIPSASDKNSNSSFRCMWTLILQKVRKLTIHKNVDSHRNELSVDLMLITKINEISESV